MLPGRDVFSKAEVGIKQVTTGAEDAGDFAEESEEVRVAMGGFDVDDGVERTVREREILGVALGKSEAGHAVALLAKADADGIEVEASVVRGAKVAGDP